MSSCSANNLPSITSMVLEGYVLRIVRIAAAAMAGMVPLSAFQPISAKTGDPLLLVDRDTANLPALTEAEYLKRMEPLAGAKNIVIMKHKPNNLSPQARFGFGFKKEGDYRHLSWILDGNEKAGYVLYADLNANGDLSDDQPMRFVRQNGRFVLDFGKESPVGLARFSVGEAVIPPDTKPSLCLKRSIWRERRGKLRIGGREVGFALFGAPGAFRTVSFDLNRNGVADPSASSPEHYDADEKFVRLEGRDYEFEIDPKGDQLTLKPLPKNLPDDQLLRAGYPAPDFTFRDLQGNSRKLSDFRGKLVLLDFWFFNCGPCQQAIPKLVAAYGKFHARGFEIIGINGEDKAEQLRPFLTEKRMSWPQILEDFEGPIHTKYRIDSAPTYYLVGPDGKIIARRLGADDFLADLEKLTAKLK